VGRGASPNPARRRGQPAHPGAGAGRRRSRAGHAYASFPRGENLLRRRDLPPPTGITWAVVRHSRPGLLYAVASDRALLPRFQRWLSRIGVAAAGLGAFLALTLMDSRCWPGQLRNQPQHSTAVASGRSLPMLGGYLAALVAVGKRPAVRKDITKVHDIWTKSSPNNAVSWLTSLSSSAYSPSSRDSCSCSACLTTTGHHRPDPVGHRT